ncbi:MAG TPA: hypothetical protein VKV57_11580 [bacterium]|nr:hypothetical protein [bacterium]
MSGPVAEAVKFTRADAYHTVTAVLMVVLGIVVLARTLAFGFHLTAVLVGLGFVGFGAYRLSFVFAYLRRRGAR